MGLGLLLVSAWVASVAAAPVEFRFTLEAGAGPEPFAREISAKVATPSGETLVLPAFYAGDGIFAVRARASGTGEYRVVKVSDEGANGAAELRVKFVGDPVQRVKVASARPAVRRSPARPDEFELVNGQPYVPLGANLAWPPVGDAHWYGKAFRQFEKAGLNWTRVWMAHWSGLNLEWRSKERGRSPRIGEFDARTARDWDFILAEAERSGVYVQLVLQHHGQWSSTVNSNWAENPWNAANPGGFLARPGEFFTSDRAIRLTRRKYRYIVARWAFSPAVLAWELFNEVHWTDAMRGDRNEAAVAKWHDDMAAYLRSIDPYRHLVTTSTDDVRSPVYSSMDYLQPHLYAINMFAAIRRFDLNPATLGRPIFFGEVGDDHMRLTAEEKRSGIELGPIAWAGVMGEGRLPAQLWEGAELLEKKRLPELRALARFLAETNWATRRDLQPFSPKVESAAKVPGVTWPAEYWHRRGPQAVRVPLDGTEPLEWGTLPSILVGSPESLADGYANRLTLRVEMPQAAEVTVRVAETGVKGAAAQVSVDGRSVAEHTWAAGEGSASATLGFALAAGQHEVVVANTGGADWLRLERIDWGVEVPALAAIGKRSADLIGIWLWHRNGVLAAEAIAPVRGELLIEEVPAGGWKVTWCDPIDDRVFESGVMQHSGGTLRLRTPAIARHAAVWLQRVETAEKR